MKPQTRNDSAQTREGQTAPRPKGEQAIGSALYEQIRAAVRELKPATR